MMQKIRLQFKQKILPYLIAYVGRFLMRMIAITCRIQIEGLERFKEVASKEKCILMLWHNRLAAFPIFMFKNAPEFKYGAFVSNSRDGEMIAVLANSYKQGEAIRVPHHSKSEALQTMIKRLRIGKKVMIITPDGPTGPVYKVKPGVAIAAKETGAPIVPWSWSSNNVWRLRTWDGLMIPKPFSTIELKFGEPIRLEKGSEPSKEEIANLEQSLLSLN